MSETPMNREENALRRRAAPLEERMPVTRRKVRRVHPHRRRLSRRRSFAHRHGCQVYETRPIWSSHNRRLLPQAVRRAVGSCCRWDAEGGRLPFASAPLVKPPPPGAPLDTAPMLPALTRARWSGASTPHLLHRRVESRGDAASGVQPPWAAGRHPAGSRRGVQAPKRWTIIPPRRPPNPTPSC